MSQPLLIFLVHHNNVRLMSVPTECFPGDIRRAAKAKRQQHGFDCAKAKRQQQQHGVYLCELLGKIGYVKIKKYFEAMILKPLVAFKSFISF
ncbi:hypothetical protein B1B04_21055 [Lysinibacillus sp. KCTC 33748]|nr:hypothetical protein B1B04_21055 [Lysinibacillus sp. KCTC 33748]